MLAAVEIHIILLAYSRLGGLECAALQRAIFCCCFLPDSLAKSSNKKKYSRGPATPAAPTSGLASSITHEDTKACHPTQHRSHAAQATRRDFNADDLRLNRIRCARAATVEIRHDQYGP